MIDEKQRAKIQTIHDQYGPQIQQKRDELQKLSDQQEAAINKLLTPKQRQQIEKLRTESRAKRQNGSGNNSADSEEMEDEPTANSKSDE